LPRDFDSWPETQPAAISFHLFKEFSQVNGTSINSSEHLEVVYSAGSVTLKVVSGP
jgi:hypothetical protein